MKLGILSDIHGDMRSFEKALALFDAHKVDALLCAGDVVEKGQDDDEVVALIRELKIPCVLGNHDENAIRHFDLSSGVDIPGEVPLKLETIEFLKTLPPVLEQEVAEVNLLIAHAIPSQNWGKVFHEDGSTRLSKRLKKDLVRAGCEILIVGHTHYPFDLRFRDKRIINPGATCSIKGRDSHTVGVLDLASDGFDVFELKDNSPSEIMRLESH